MIVNSTWYSSKEELESDVADYQAALEAHKLTVGVPRPFPPNDLVGNIVALGGTFEWVEQEPTGEVNVTPAEQRAARYKRETDPMFMKLFELATLSVEDTLCVCKLDKAGYDTWIAAKAQIRAELPDPE